MKLTFYEGSKICDERDQQLHFETETFALWSSKFETDTDTFEISLKF